MAKLDIYSTKIALRNAQTFEGKQKVLEVLLSQNSLTDEIIQEFRGYFTKEIFSKSYMLEYELIQKYPELFDRSLWDETTKKSISAILSLGETSQVLQYIQDLSFLELNKYYKELYNEFKDIDGVAEYILTHIRDSTFIESEIVKLEPSFWMNKIKNKVVQEYLYGDPERIKINSISDLLNILRGSNNLKYNLTLIDKYLDEDSLEHSDSEFVINSLIFKFPDDIAVKIIRLVDKYARLSYNSLQYLLAIKDLDEDELIQLIEIFHKYGGERALLEYSKEKEYHELEQLIILKNI